MADLNLQGYRIKAVPQVPLNVELLSSGITHDDVNDTAVEYIQLENVAPVPATFAITTDVTTTLGNAIITGDFSSYDIRPGDGVSGSNIAFGSKVAAVINETTISLDQNSTATGTINDVVITPPTYSPNVFAIAKNFSISGSTLTMRIQVQRSDGLLNNDTDGDGVDNSTYLEYPTYIDQTIQVDLDTFLTNLRVDRS